MRHTMLAWACCKAAVASALQKLMLPLQHHCQHRVQVILTASFIGNCKHNPVGEHSMTSLYCLVRHRSACVLELRLQQQLCVIHVRLFAAHV